MTTVRCPSCDAAVPADAAWCTLCFAQLRTQPEPPAPSVASPAVAAPNVPDPDPLGPDFVLSPPAPPVAAPAPVAATTATAVAEDTGPTWPCTSCEAQVSLEEMTCPRCGTAFMGGVTPSVSLRVPGVGDLVTMSSGGRFGIMAGGAVLLSLLLVLLFLVLGHIF